MKNLKTYFLIFFSISFLISFQGFSYSDPCKNQLEIIIQERLFHFGNHLDIYKKLSPLLQLAKTPRIPELSFDLRDDAKLLNRMQKDRNISQQENDRILATIVQQLLTSNIEIVSYIDILTTAYRDMEKYGRLSDWACLMYKIILEDYKATQDLLDESTAAVYTQLLDLGRDASIITNEEFTALSYIKLL